MDLRVWSALDDRLIEVRIERSTERGPGVWVEDLPDGRARTTAERIRAALVNSGFFQEAPAVSVRLVPPVPGPTAELDLPIALAVLGHAGRVGAGLRWILASGRLGLDGRVYTDGDRSHSTLADAVGACQTPAVESEPMFGAFDSHE